jgi:probable phosphoglycerate mutase
MSAALFVRHGRTSWNVAGRVQGRTDIALSAYGRRQVAGWRLPQAFREARWYCSPLARAHETARLLGCPDPVVDPRLAEMSWGHYEGQTLDELRARYGSEFATNEARGLDFRPPGGESPREVAARLSAFLAELDTTRDSIIVAHKGVLRAAVVLACDWDMRGPGPVPIQDNVALLCSLDVDGKLSDMSCLPLRGAY